MAPLRPVRPEPSPWGRPVALGAACVVTLLGVCRGLDPDVILVRALVAALLLGFLARVVQLVVNRCLRAS